MNKFYMKLSLLACLSLCISGNVLAEIISGSTYRITNVAGTKAVTNNGTAANGTLLSGANISTTDNGQTWILIQGSDGYWHIQSNVKNGNTTFNWDDPTHGTKALNTQLLQWTTGDANDNQKWVLKVASDADDTYYAYPKAYEGQNVCYAFDSSNKLTMQNLSTTSALQLKFTEIVVAETPDPIYYRIMTEDGSRSLSTRGLTANDTKLSMEPVSSDGGQYWSLTATGSKYFITSYLANVHIDNPSFHNLIIWSAGTGDNQKWTLTPIANTDSVFYMVSNENKAYGYNSDWYLTPKNSGDEGTRLKIKTARLPEPVRLGISGEYAFQFVSCYPSYNYNSEGKYLAYNPATNALSLTSDYSYDKCRFAISVKDGVAMVKVPGDSAYIYKSSSSLKVVGDTSLTNLPAAAMSFFLSNEALNLDTRVAWEAGSKTATLNNRLLSMVLPNSIGTSVAAVGSTNVKDAYNLKLIPLTPSSTVKTLKDLVSQAKSLQAAVTGDDATTLASAITWAQAELDYLYLTTSDVAIDAKRLSGYMTSVSKIAARIFPATAISAVQSTVTVEVVNRCIKVNGTQLYKIYNSAGVCLNHTKEPLPEGVYFVKVNKVSYKVIVK